MHICLTHNPSSRESTGEHCYGNHGSPTPTSYFTALYESYSSSCGLSCSVPQSYAEVIALVLIDGLIQPHLKEGLEDLLSLS